MDIDLGKKIKAVRTKAGLSIKELAEKASVSTGLISQIENGKVVPSVTALYKVAKALNVSVGYFFDDEPTVHTNPVVRKNERKRLIIDKATGIYELLTPDMNRKIEFLSIILKGGESSNTELIAHEGEECGYVLKGHLLVKVGNNEYYLGEGDSISFDSSIPHRYINIGDRESYSIWAMTPPSF
ncbi:cupin domain-containing protein [Fusibacter bizertensis]